VKYQSAQLQSFCRIVQGGRHGFSGNDFVSGGHPAYGAGGLNGYLPEYEFDEPAVILSAIGARCGKCFYAEGKWASLANTQVIIPDPQKADPKFLWYQLNDERRWHRSGTGQPFIKPADVKAHLVLLPPLPEQQRIAGILGMVESLLAKRRATLAHLDSLTQSIFLDMFGDPATNPKRWPVATLGEVISLGPQNGLYKPSTNYGSGTPILRIDAFYDGVVTKLAALKRVRISNEERAVYGLRSGEIVINRVNSREYLGKSALIPPLPEPTVFESNMMRFDVDRDRLDPGYLIQFLQTGYVKTRILQSAKDAVNQSSINQQDVKALPLVMPPLANQQVFTRRSASVDRCRFTHRTSLVKFEVLFCSLRQRAFRGEL
jgi:type I restriction enzyme S subunit